MYGYEPPKEPRQGTWREVVSFSWIALTIIGPVMLGVVATMLLVVATFALFTVHPALALIPVAGLVLGVVGVIWRDRRNQAALEAELQDETPKR